MPEHRFLEVQEDQATQATSEPRTAELMKTESVYSRDIQPNLEKLPVSARLKSGLVTGLSTVVLSMALIWALVAAATLATAQPGTMNLSLGYVAWFPVSLLLQPQVWLWFAIIMAASIWGMWKPRLRSPEGISFFLWVALFLALYSSTLFDGRLDAFTKVIGGVLLGFHSAFVTAVFFLVSRKVRGILAKKAVKVVEGDRGPC